MRRISFGILVAVAVFMVLVTGTLVMKSRAIRMEPAEPVTSKADYRIKDVQLEEESGNVRWKLVADQSEVFEAEGRTGLRRPVVDIQQPLHAPAQERLPQASDGPCAALFESRWPAALEIAGGRRLVEPGLGAQRRDEAARQRLRGAGVTGPEVDHVEPIRFA